MRQELPKKVEYNRVSGPYGTRNGACILKCGSVHLRIIFSDGMGWDHVSVSLPTRVPAWSEMCWVKDVFFESNEVVMQLHPAKENYVNNHPNCLHLWRPQSADEIQRIKEDWGDDWVYGDIESPGAIPLPRLVMV